MLSFDDDWVWDSWPVPLHCDTSEPADDAAGPRHLFFLHAPRSLGDPDLRHDFARIGHAVSADLRDWTRLPDPIAPGPAGAVDDHATWTGSVVRTPQGPWHLYYTGVTRTDGPGGVGPYLQRVCRAVSNDLTTWRKQPEPVVSADPRWYALAGETEWVDEHWRDPWVFADPGGDGWHMLITARARPEQWPNVDVDDLGVLGHAWSPDLQHWEERPPLSAPGAGFGHLEVPQVVRVDGRWCLVFSCLVGELASARRAAGATGGHWLVTDVDPTGPYDTARAVPLFDDGLYAGRILTDRTGPVLLAFDNRWDTDTGGTLVDPVRVRLPEARPAGARPPPQCAQSPDGYGAAQTS